MNTHTHTNRIGLFIVAGLLSLALFGFIINKYVLQSNAAQFKADVAMFGDDETSGSSKFGLFIIPEEIPNSNIEPKISGIDFSLEVKNGTLEWDQCQEFADLDGNTPDFKEALNVPGIKARYSCVILADDSKLAENILLTGTAKCSGKDDVTVTIASADSQVTGPVPDAQYALSFENTSYTFKCDGEDNGGSNPGDEVSKIPPRTQKDIAMHFAPKECIGKIGDTCDFTFGVDGSQHKNSISGYYVKFRYNNNLLKLESIDDPKTSQGVLGLSTSYQNLLAQNAAPVTAAPTGTSCTECDVNGDGVLDAKDTADLIQKVSNPNLSPADQAELKALVEKCIFANKCIPSPDSGAVPSGVVKPTSSIPGPSGVVPPQDPNDPQDPQDPQNPPATGQCTIVDSNVDDEKGFAELLVACDHPRSSLPLRIENDLHFNLLRNGEGELLLEEARAVGPKADLLYSIEDFKARYNIGGSGNVDVNLKVRMQGILKKPKHGDEVDFRIGFKDGALGDEPSYKKVTLKYQDNGYAVGSTTFNIPPGNGYVLLVKGPQHSQTKVCVNNPKAIEEGKYTCGAGRISLKNGKNDFDLTDIIQFTGDIPDENGNQDGISNGRDFAVVRSFIGKDSAEALRRADLNDDSVVNTIDYGLMMSARYIQLDQR